ncbi:MBL fold metallo-hydrolase [Modestobacter versicolor]|uniref:L-ascorbate metabolism protein UlaG (Beta-lactamase superfamily) n=1 Tax=Modestobacter versicolor TaxID=429133 RepID=A0A323VAH7_9ACTN|nr:MBL fold metallo-hydrolase [Modestobacter versicolor]MBB3677579.1 L-ascorbate metabolism protein UlaG (beta-lactamase superfamily) [Modestobacter versicolor]PZA21749.1 metal-dependent hydrolase [Modestobacter versicolor]
MAGDSPDTADDVTLTFGGNATTLLRLGPFTLLTDPNFLHRGQRAHLGYGLRSKRLTEPALQPTQLPALDAVLLSHMHGDHWDRIATRSMPKDVPVVTTPEAARCLAKRGFTGTADLRPWQTHELTSGTSTLRVTSVPGVHGPGPLARLLPQVMGSVLELVRGGVAGSEVVWRGFISGDTLFRPALGEVLERCGPLDVLIPHLGGTRIPPGILVTMDGRQGADLVELLRPPVTVPVHYDDYTVFRSPLGDFLAEVAKRRAPGEIRTVGRGQTVSLRA